MGKIYKNDEDKQWKKFEDKDIYYKLTKSLLELYKFCEKLNDDPDAELKDNKEKYDAIADLENDDNKGKLDKGFYAVQSYIRQYNIYKNKKFKMDRNGQEGYYINYKGEFWIVKDELKIVGEVLNSSTTMLERYKEDIGDKNNFSELSKMFFHLVTTVGNVMPWPMYYGYRPVNKELDIAQTKFQYYIGLYGRVNNTGIDKKSWIKAFVEGHYLQDFVTDDMEKALEFLNLDKVYKLKDDNALQNWVENIAGKKGSVGDDVEKVWNLYFYRASKAIMKRSYRILKEIDGDFSPEQKKEFNEKFQEFCEEYKVKQELEKLKEYLDKHEDEKIKCNETDEIKALIDKL